MGKLASDGRVTLREIFEVSRNPDLTLGEKALWNLYRSYDSGKGAWPGDELLSAHLGRFPRSIQNYRQGLLSKGFLKQKLMGPKPARHFAVLPPEVQSVDATPESENRRQDSKQDSQAVSREEPLASQDDPQPASQPAAKQASIDSKTDSQIVTQEASQPNANRVREEREIREVLPISDKAKPPALPRDPGGGHTSKREEGKKGNTDGLDPGHLHDKLREYCLLGSDSALVNGMEIGFRLLRMQFYELIEKFDVHWEEGLGAISMVRAELRDGSPNGGFLKPDDPFSLKIFLTHPENFHRCLGAYRKRLPPARLAMDLCPPEGDRAAGQ